jgi:serine phosphatase RsbU (regulator of sigma subunit)
MTERVTAEPWFRTTALFLVVFVGYAAGAVLSLKAFGASELGPAFFPPAGLTVAAMLSTRRTRWPVIVTAIILAETIVDMSDGIAPGAVLGYALANSMEPLLGASLVLRWCKGTPDLRRRRDLVVFISGACLAGPLLGGLIGGGSVALHLGAWWPGAVMRWFASDAIGVLVVAAPILLWPKQFHLLRERPVESIGTLGTTGAMSWLTIWGGLQSSLLILPVLVWAGLRLDVLGAALAGSGAAFAANLRAASGLSLFGDMNLSAPSRLVLIQALIGINVVVAMLIAQEAAARRQANREHKVELRERMRLDALSQLAQQLSAALTPGDVGQALSQNVLNRAGATALSLGLVSSDGTTLEWVAMSGYPRAVLEEFGDGVALSERTVATDAIRTGMPIAIRTSAEYDDTYPDQAHWSRISGAESTAGWPLNYGGKPIGALLMVWPETQPLDAPQRAFMAAVTTMATQALVRTQAHSDEHARAVTLQSAALPIGATDGHGLEVCVTYEPVDVGRALGGDWYDVLQLPTSRTYLAVGDVVGQGPSAVADMVQLRGAGRAMAHQGLPPAQLLAELSGFTRNVSQGKFATMAVAIFDPNDRSLSYCSAGHPPPMFRRFATGRVIRLSDAEGPVLGAARVAGYLEGRLSVAPGDILVMYTDGLVGRDGTDIEIGLASAERMIADWNPDTTMGAHCELLQERLAPQPRTDDVCILAIRFNAADLPYSIASIGVTGES